MDLADLPNRVRRGLARIDRDGACCVRGIQAMSAIAGYLGRSLGWSWMPDFYQTANRHIKFLSYEITLVENKLFASVLTISRDRVAYGLLTD